MFWQVYFKYSKIIFHILRVFVFYFNEINLYYKMFKSVKVTGFVIYYVRIHIFFFKEPIPGEWTLYVTSESAHSIRACGVSSKNFNFGFATAKPKNMTQTSHRPLKGKFIF
jgi:hypothetical protein